MLEVQSAAAIPPRSAAGLADLAALSLDSETACDSQKAHHSMINRAKQGVKEAGLRALCGRNAEFVQV